MFQLKLLDKSGTIFQIKKQITKFASVSNPNKELQNHSDRYLDWIAVINSISGFKWSTNVRHSCVLRTKKHKQFIKIEIIQQCKDTQKAVIINHPG